MPTQSPHHVDKTVGMNVRRIRKDRGLSQESLAEAIGVTFQQVQKYERGDNRISASRMFEICKTLACGYGDLMPDLEQACGPDVRPWQDDGRLIELRHPGITAALAALDPKVLGQLHNTARAVLSTRAMLDDSPELSEAIIARSAMPEGMHGVA